MREAGVDVALFDEIEAMTWLSGFGNSENRWRCVGVPLEGEPFFLIRALDASPCRQRTWITDVPTFRDWEDPMPALASALGKRGLQDMKIGLDFGSYCMPLARFAHLREALPAARRWGLPFYSHAGPRTSDFTRIFHPGARWRLEPQMVFHMYASAQGASFSETVLVTDNGHERLTRLPRTLIINH